jgi:hypothetical protein
MGQEQLKQEIISRSDADTWDQARREWALSEVYFASDPDQCLCGQYPIIELCILKNQVNGGEAIVGNVCVRRFLRLPSNEIFTGLKRIQVKPTAALTEAAVRYAFERGWIDAWERDFYLDTRTKRKMSERQAATRLRINEKVSAGVTRNARPGRGAR